VAVTEHTVNQERNRAATRPKKPARSGTARASPATQRRRRPEAKPALCLFWWRRLRTEVPSPGEPYDNPQPVAREVWDALAAA
jgi:hypothetical protein